MKPLANNRELYDYLLSLASQLRQGGATSLVNGIERAAGNAASLVTEFLGESRIALRQVLAEERDILTEQQRMEVADVLGQLDAALAPGGQR